MHKLHGFGLALVLAAAACAPTTPPTSGPFVPASPSGPAVPPAPVIVSVSGQTPSPAYAAVEAADRSADDRALDGGRKPAEVLAFFGIGSGMRVAELGAGGGYTAELLARTVGPRGKVYAQNSRTLLERFAEKPWSDRLAKPVMANVVRVNRELDDPFPAAAKDLDAVVIVLFYHDSVWLKTDRDKMNRAVFAALRPGGIYGIVDHAAKDGSGVNDVETLHRIEEKLVRDEVLHAGFELEAESNVLRNPSDARDWNASPRKAAERRGTSDRFVLRFKKH
ncbi:MAG TPA: SAM-dependent methyltransferase [Polyangiaceae bacterium]|nr:SAM-dependent methyltransferase [Polyangiaceae bacterium]